MHLRTGLEKLCTDAHVQMHISDGFFLISMQQTHLFCCLEESQQTWRNTCVSSVLSPCELPYSIAVLCSHRDPFQSPSWTCLSQQTQSSTSGRRQSMNSAGCCMLRREEGNVWVDWSHRCVGGALGMLRPDGFWRGWDRRMSSQDLRKNLAFGSCKWSDTQHIQSFTWGVVVGFKKMNQAVSLLPCSVLVTRVCH